MLRKIDLEGIAKELKAASHGRSNNDETFGNIYGNFRNAAVGVGIPVADPMKAEQYYQGVQETFQGTFGVKDRITEKGAFIYCYNSIFRGTDRATVAGLLLFERTQQVMKEELVKVWKERLELNIYNMLKVLEVAFGHREIMKERLLPEFAEPVKLMPKTLLLNQFISAEWTGKMPLVEVLGAKPGAKVQQIGFVLCKAFGGIIPGEVICLHC